MMSPSVRKFTLALHLTFSTGWIGGVVAYLALGLAAATTQDADTVRAAWIGMELTGWFAIVPLALASLLTGLLMSLGTKWGLFRHYWVLISFVLTIIATTVLLIEIRTISSLAALAEEPTTTADQLRSMGSTLAHSIGGMLVLLVVL